MEKKRSIGELSNDTKLLYMRLKATTEGEIISYEDLAQTIGGRRIQAGDKQAYGNLQSAIRKCLHQDSIVFEAIPNIGIKRLGDASIVNSSQSLYDKIHRVTSKIRKKLACVRDFNAMTNEQKIAHHTAMSLSGMLSEATKARNIVKFEKNMADKLRLLSITETIKLQLTFYQDKETENDGNGTSLPEKNKI